MHPCSIFPCSLWETEVLEKARPKGMRCLGRPVNTIRERETAVCSRSIYYSSLNWAILGFVAGEATGNSEAVLCSDHRNL